MSDLERKIREGIIKTFLLSCLAFIIFVAVSLFLVTFEYEISHDLYLSQEEGGGYSIKEGKPMSFMISVVFLMALSLFSILSIRLILKKSFVKDDDEYWEKHLNGGE